MSERGRKLTLVSGQCAWKGTMTSVFDGSSTQQRFFCARANEIFGEATRPTFQRRHVELRIKSDAFQAFYDPQSRVSQCLFCTSDC